MTWQPTTRLQVSGYRFLLRRIEHALLRGDLRMVHESIRAPRQSLLAGCVLTAVGVAGCAVLALLRPQATLGNAPIVIGQESGALYVRVGETLHPVLNLASARLIAATNANPQPVRESELGRAKRGPLLGIPGAPQLVAEPLPRDESAWAICDTGGNTEATTTVIAGPVDPGPASHRLTPDQTVLVTLGPGAATYLLYSGQRAVVNLTDPAVVRALRLEGFAPRTVSRLLLNAIPEVPPILAPRIAGAGARGPLPGFPVGSVVRLARVGADEYYVVLPGGIQRIGQVAADLLRLNDSQGAREVISVAPDLIRAIPTVHELPVFAFPDRASVPLGGGEKALCATWAPPESTRAAISFLVGSDLPLPAGQAPVILAQADGAGPALDAVYLPPGRSAYVRPTGPAGELRADARYLVADTGVRFAVHDDDAATNLGLPPTAVQAPWSVLAALPFGPELSRHNASVARDTVIPGPAGARSKPQPP